MKSFALQIIGLLCLSTSALAGEDLGGMSLNFTPDTARPGDLITLWVQMNREDYAEFDLEVPSHPQLHLVAREQIPPAHVNGQYYQGERLMLQPLSSGEITLTGVTVQLTEAAGPREVELPEITLTVQAFGSTDEEATPEVLPATAGKRGLSPSIFLPLFGMVVGAFFLILLIRLRMNLPVNPEASEASAARNFDSILRAASISNEDLEAVFNQKGSQLSEDLRSDIETYLYAPEENEAEREALHQRLRKELDT
jgi:hypothetical protein